MSIKRLIKQCIPPIITSLLSTVLLKLKMKSKRSPYQFKVDVDHHNLEFAENDLWQHPNWVKNVHQSLVNARGKKELTVHQDTLNLGFDIVRASTPAQENITILDFGGGVGLNYYAFKNNTCLEQHACNFLVVDNPKSIAIGQEEFRDDAGVQLMVTEDFFAASIQQSLKDQQVILNLSSLLHYILDWQSLLDDLLKLNPKAICISRFPLCLDAKQQAFAIQDVTTRFGYCGSTKVVLFSGGDLETFMHSRGYQKVSDQTSSLYNFFWNGCSMPEYERVAAKAYLFLRSN